MNCEEFWNGEPHALDHLEDCRPCALRFERHQRLAAGLNALGAQVRRVAAPDRVERRLTAAFRSRAELGRAHPPGVWWLVGTWAAALAATAALGLFLVRPHQPDETRHFKRSVTQLAAVDIDSGFALDAAANAEFIPLPNAEQLAPNEAVNLVRLEVPRSAMMAVGLTVSPERASELVEVDVMLGPDGVARAVRFLDE